jgi:hypothetical protein
MDTQGGGRMPTLIADRTGGKKLRYQELRCKRRDWPGFFFRNLPKAATTD